MQLLISIYVEWSKYWYKEANSDASFALSNRSLIMIDKLFVTHRHDLSVTAHNK